MPKVIELLNEGRTEDVWQMCCVSLTSAWMNL